MMAPIRFIFVALTVGAVGCDRAVPTRERIMSASVASTSLSDAASPALAEQLSSVAAARAQGVGRAPAATWADQKLIRTADLRIEAKDVGATLRSIENLAVERDALVADAHVTQDANGKRNAHLVIRVASPRFNDILSGLRPLGKVKSENISTQDITKEYADLETRTVVKEATVARLRALLENRTGKLADVLEVERELSRAVTELEQMKGERRYYDRQVAVSSIAVDVYELGQIASGGIAEPVTEALHRSLGLLATSASMLIYGVVFLAPWAALLAGAWWVGARYFRVQG
jgi:Domain of unknown function (DUF4349)